MLVKKLNLPPPSDEIIKLFRDYESSIELSPSSQQWLDNFHDNTVNCAAHWFGAIPVLDKMLQEQYQQYFSQPIIAGGGIMENWKSLPACQPPHSDRGRKLAINWYVDLGGDAVDTVFYHETAVTRHEATNFKYTDVHELARYRFAQNTWYAYEVDRCHSVENIQTRRSFLSIGVMGSFPSFYSLEDLGVDNIATIAV